MIILFYLMLVAWTNLELGVGGILLAIVFQLLDNAEVSTN
jgi:hypothetical protein